MNRTISILVKFVLPVVVLAAAGALTARLISSREAPSQTDPEEDAAVVDTEVVHEQSHRLDVRASGTVEPARQMQVQPEVSGRVVDVHDELQPGGLVEKGETIVQLDRSDYRLAVRQRKTALEQAKSQMALEKGRQEVAEREWELFKDEADELTRETDPSLALRKPQLGNAKAQVDAAQARLEQARLNLSRTSVEAPFDALVRDESVSIGDLAGAQSPVATLVGTDAFWARLKVSPGKIPYIDIPGVNADTGSKVEIEYETGDTAVKRVGRVLRLAGGLDRRGRLARVIVRIDDPLGLASEDDSEFRGVPLLLDSYVDARIRGGETRELVELPRDAVRNGDQVYVYDDGTLAIRTLEIAWRRPSSVLVSGGLEDGDRVVVGPMPNPLEGMSLERADPGGNTEPEPSRPDDETPSSGASDDSEQESSE